MSPPCFVPVIPGHFGSVVYPALDRGEIVQRSAASVICFIACLPAVWLLGLTRCRGNRSPVQSCPTRYMVQWVLRVSAARTNRVCRNERNSHPPIRADCCFNQCLDCFVMNSPSHLAHGKRAIGRMNPRNQQSTTPTASRATISATTTAHARSSRDSGRFMGSAPATPLQASGGKTGRAAGRGACGP